MLYFTHIILRIFLKCLGSWDFFFLRSPISQVFWKMCFQVILHPLRDAWFLLQNNIFPSSIIEINKYNSNWIRKIKLSGNVSFISDFLGSWNGTMYLLKFFQNNPLDKKKTQNWRGCGKLYFLLTDDSLLIIYFKKT